VFGVQLDTERVLDYIRPAAHERTGPCTIRVTVFDPRMTLGNIGDPAEPQVLVTTRPADALSPRPLAAKTFPFSRDLAVVKHIGLFGQLRLRREAQLSGFDDAIFVEADGRISEGVTWNLGFVDRDGQVVWPDAPVLPGVTMQLLQDAHGDSISAPVTHSQLADMRAAFATNVSIGVRTIKAIDDVRFPIDDSALDLLRKVYAELPGEPL
jgi:branched-subunit amino acid aminotransferase/4-amino-4-deoxychorismate lyase